MKLNARPLILGFLAAAAVFGILAAIQQQLPFEKLIFAAEKHRELVSTAADITAARQSMWLLAAFISTGFALLAGVVSNRESLQRFAPAAFSFCITAGCAAVLFALLIKEGSEGPWYPLDTIVNKPGELPIFGTRLFMVSFAWVLKLIHPMPVHRLFLGTQALAVIAAAFMTRTWSTLFIGARLSWLGPVLLVMLLGPTFTYFTFYDIAIVFFWSLGLWAAMRGKNIVFVATVIAGTFNHENILLLVPVAAAMMWKQTNRLSQFIIAAAAVAGHFASRAVLWRLYPTKTLAVYSLLGNTSLLFHPARAVMVDAVLILPLLFICTVIATLYADATLQRAWCIALPLLLGVTLLMGQMNEIRQFDALIPLIVALFLYYIRREINAVTEKEPVA